MQRDQDRHKLFTRRVAMLAGGKFILLSGLAARMYYLQVIESEKYRTLAEENRINIKLLPPPRGRIVDRSGVPLAVNRQNYQVVLVSEQAGDPEETLDRLGQIIEIGESDRRRVLREIRRKRSFVPVTVRENLKWEEVARIEVNAPDLPGVSIEEGQTRFYPFGESTAHILGYVAAVSQEELTGDPLLELPGFRIGKSGIEKIHDLALRGAGGNSQVEVNAYGRVIRELSRNEGQPGQELALTIDMELQRMVVDRLADEGASAVVMDVHTGEVLAMASTPGYEPNAFNKGLDAKQWRTLVSNPKAPLINKSIAGQYAPGSTFKMVVALAALEKGVISPSTTFYCPGSLKLGNARFHCWKRGGHGRVDLDMGIYQSCDVYFYEVAKRTGIEAITAMAHRLGLGHKLDLDLPGERTGLMPTREWKLATIGIPWQKGETLIAGIGQGYVLTTPLQLAVMTARLANGKYAVTPHLTRDLVSAKKTEKRGAPEFETMGISSNHLRLVRDAMIATVNYKRGTAYRARIEEEGLEMAGKTGTAQVRRISKAERDRGVIKNEDLPWEQRDHALFVGYAPMHKPRFAAAVVVEHGGGGSKVAAPIVRDILLKVQKLERDKGLTNISASETPAVEEG